MSYIKPRIIYHDKLSQASTYPYNVKPKNKLAGYCVQEELGVHLFFILNSKDKALIKRFTVSYNNTDHIENKHPDLNVKYMMNENGYCDVTKFELVTHGAVIAKKSDPRNGFAKVGRLAKDKWIEIKTIIESPHFRADSKGASSDATLTELIKGVNDKGTAQVILSNLGIR